MVESASQVVLIVSVILAILGLLCLILSILILARQAMGHNIQTIADQTTKLAQKGLTDGVSGLVGNASLLISSLNDLARSNTGIGIFFVFLAIVLLAAAFYILRPLLAI
jgi:Na+-transporting methylmalonyl-CoA/oxaloacetate decarboxylase gamma subunit